MSEEARAIYLFCCARAALLPPDELRGAGLDDASGPLRVHRSQDLVAVVCEVRLDELAGPAAQARLQDLAWLAPRALRHQQVIEEVARRSPVFPARFATLFTSPGSLDRMLERHRETIRGFLEETAGTEEWGIKGFLDRKRARERLVDEELAAPRSRLPVSPGQRYLQERRIRAEADARLGRWLSEASGRIKGILCQWAARAVERRPLASPDRTDEMVLNWAYLVPKPAVEEFRSEVERLGRELRGWGLSFECVGPFPPYSFTPALPEPHA